MLKTVRATGVPALLLVVNGVSAHTPSQPPHQLCYEGDLKLESGEVIKDSQSRTGARRQDVRAK
jgi:hypothetical protein